MTILAALSRSVRACNPSSVTTPLKASTRIATDLGSKLPPSSKRSMGIGASRRTVPLYDIERCAETCQQTFARAVSLSCYGGVSTPAPPAAGTCWLSHQPAKDRDCAFSNYATPAYTEARRPPRRTPP